VTVIAMNTLAVTRRFPIRSGMDAVTVDPGTDLVYLGGRREFVVGLYEPQQFGPVDAVDTGAGVAHMTLDVEENTLYMLTPGTRRVLTVDRIRKRPAGEIDVGDGPAWVSVMGEH
jgi:hypothetical protein